MADTDITLTVGLDPKSINQQLNDIRKEVERQMGEAQKEINKASSGNTTNTQNIDITPEVDTAALDVANARIQELQESINQLQYAASQITFQYFNNLQYAESAQPAVDHIAELMQELNQLETQLGENPALEGAQERVEQIGSEITTIIQTLVQSGQAWERPTQDVVALQNQINLLNAQITQLESRLRTGSNEMTRFGTQARESAGNMLQMVRTFSSGTANAISSVLNKAFRTLKRIAVTVVGITLGVRGIQSIINKLRASIKEGFKYIYEGDKKFKKQVDDLKKSWMELKANLAAAFMPIVQIAIPYIQRLIDWLNLLIDKIAMFVAAIAGQNAYTKAIKATGDAADKASKQLSKYDEINNISTQGKWSTFKVPIDQKMLDLAEKFKAILKEIKDFFNENIFEPFKRGFEKAVGDWRSKLQLIKDNIIGIKDSLINIFADNDVFNAWKNALQSLSEFLGAGTGLGVNIGLNLADAITGGIEKYLSEHEDEIKEDFIKVFEIDADVFANLTTLTTNISKIIDVLGESEAAEGAIANIADAVEDIVISLDLISLKTIEGITGIFATMSADHVDEIRTTVASLFETIEKGTESVSAFTQIIKDSVLKALDVLDPVFNTITTVASGIYGMFLQIVQRVLPIFNYLFGMLTQLWQEYVSPVANDIMDILKELATQANIIMTWLWTNILKPVLEEFIDKWYDDLVPKLKVAFAIIGVALKVGFTNLHRLLTLIKDITHFITRVVSGDGIIPAAVELIKAYIAHIVEWIVTDTSKIRELIMIAVNAVIAVFNQAKSQIMTAIETLKTGILVVWALITKGPDKLKEILTQMKDHIKEFFRSIPVLAVKAINFLIGVLEAGINEIMENLDALGIVDKLNDKFNLNLGTVTLPKLPVNIPALAQGAVIPPSMSDFIARLGDNNKETEIVSPLSTMKEAMLDALQQAGGFGGDINIELTVDGSTLARTVVRQNEIYRRQTGRSLLAT